MTPEGFIKKDICQYLTACGIFHRVIQVGGIRGRKNTGKGVSDIIAFPPGKCMAIEVKTKTGVLSKEQIEFLDGVALSGNVSVVARCLEDVILACESGKSEYKIGIG